MNQATTHWQEELKSLITDPVLLFKQLELDPTMLPEAQRIVSHFPLRVTPSFVARMHKRKVDDPLLQQVLPLSKEKQMISGFVKDPLEERQHNPIPGLLHKYHGRVLITVTGGCAIHCRYCFRRHFPYAENTPGQKLDKIINYIERDQSIYEVILSGGDPLMANDTYLNSLFGQLAAIPHLKIVRIHARLPVVLPSRINESFIQSLTSTRLKPILVIHCNHAQEIDMSVMRGLEKLYDAGVKLLNQSVLLKDINDTTAALATLSYRLLDCHVTPYYLHMLDKVEGAAHFEVDLIHAKRLYYELRACLPGYLVPLLVEEKPGAPSKLPVI